MAAGLLIFFCAAGTLPSNLGGLISLAPIRFDSLEHAGVWRDGFDRDVALSDDAGIGVVHLAVVAPRDVGAGAGKRWAFVALLLLSKPTAMVMFPLTAILIGVKLWLRADRWSGAWGAAGLDLVTLGADRTRRGYLLHSCSMRWWDGRRQFLDALRFPLPSEPRTPLRTGRSRCQGRRPIPSNRRMLGFHGVVAACAFFATRLSARDRTRCSGRTRVSQHSWTGHWTLRWLAHSFPYAMWVKTPPALILLLLVSLVGWWRLGDDRPRT